MNAHAGREAFEMDDDNRGKVAAHIALGALLAGGAILASTLLARRHEHLADDDDQYAAEYAEAHASAMHPPKAITSLVLPPLFIAMTLSGLRVWNSPVSPNRTRALTLWSFIQGFNAIWLALGAGKLGGRLTAATASIAASVAYALSARKIEAPKSPLASPYLGWIGFANALNEGLWRKAKAMQPTMH